MFTFHKTDHIDYLNVSVFKCVVIIEVIKFHERSSSSVGIFASNKCTQFKEIRGAVAHIIIKTC